MTNECCVKTENKKSMGICVCFGGSTGCKGMVNVTPNKYYDLVADFGIKKEPKMDFNEEEMNKVADKIMKDIKSEEK